ncbi:hypothetical protein HPB51_003048 [Rhipicephalus microplus]|uniref:CCHC-type domain-containing protein n=1 Tax=Rhipicephalus microplus TaxID=6941 RepID=A0A9J6EEY1_RHIMP|nr:hypothetical protein HPB51_003048 [Rhipicephalus microplus]
MGKLVGGAAATDAYVRGGDVELTVPGGAAAVCGNDGRVRETMGCRLAMWVIHSIRQALGEFGEVLEVSNDNWIVADFEHAISTTRVVRLKLKEGVVLEDLPHLFKIEGGTVLLVAPGRAPLCLRCHMQGHIRRDCQTLRCGVCRVFGHESQDCVRSYARVMKTVLPTDDTQDNLMDAEEAEKLAPGSNAAGPESTVQATGEETADATTQDGKDSTKESEELAATGGQQYIQESMEEDMGTSGEIATPGASTKSP